MLLFWLVERDFSRTMTSSSEIYGGVMVQKLTSSPFMPYITDFPFANNPAPTS